MIKKTTFLLPTILIGILLLTTSCRKSKKNAIVDSGQATQSYDVSLRQGWFPWAGYAGELVAMEEFDSVFNINLKINPGADDIDPVKMVLSGTNDFGITSAEAIVLANQKGADLIAIATVNYKSPTSFIVLDENINNPKDFEGKTIGILTGTETETVYRLLLEKNNISKEKINEVEAPYDLKAFINGYFDVYPGFIYSEPLALEYQNIEYKLIKPENYNVELIGAVYFTTRKYINENPELVQAFINALAMGWEKALQNPSMAISYLKEFDNTIDEERELASLIKGREYFEGEGGRILFSSDSTWNNLKDALVLLQKVGPETDISESYDYSFVKIFHSN
ncbi:MAG: ABC transporter substrate-binding protein [Bacteroidota bacterium]